MNIDIDSLIHSMDIQRLTRSRRTPSINIPRQGPVEPRIGISGHNVATHDDLPALETRDGFKDRASDAREPGPDGVGVGVRWTDWGGAERAAEGSEGEVVVEGRVDGIAFGEGREGEVIFLHDGGDDIHSAVLDIIWGLVQRDTVVDEGADFLGESVGFDAAVDDVCCLGGLEDEAKLVAARGGQFLCEGDVVAGLEGGGEPGLDL